MMYLAAAVKKLCAPLYNFQNALKLTSSVALILGSTKEIIITLKKISVQKM